MFSLINPYTQLNIAQRNYSTDKELEEKLQIANDSFYIWRKQSIENRIKYVRNLVEVVSQKKVDFAKQMSAEMGKPVAQAVAEIEKCLLLCDYYCENAASFLEDEVLQNGQTKCIVRKQSLGVILGIMPWNFPFWQVFRFAIPSLLAGNTIFLKHADNVQLSAESLEKSFQEAGFPEGTYLNICITHTQVENLLKDARVKAVSLTGSTRAGKAVASLAGESLKPSLLELGGNNALIVMPDAPIDKTVKLCVKARFQNTGQSCIAGKRLLLHASIYTQFMEKLTDQVRNLTVGDPTNKNTYISVLAREDLAVQLKKQLDDSVAMGAKITLGGKQENAFFEPTIVENVSPEMPIFNEETFGPLLAVTSFDTLEEAIKLSNNSNYGLGVSIFTKNIDEVIPYINDFEEGAININDFVKSDPKLPFGGVKNSGYGRELAKEGILSFVNLQSIQINEIKG